MNGSAWEFVAGQLWARIADASLRAIVLAALAGLLIFFLRKRSAAQHAVWVLVTIGMLALPWLRPIIPAAHVPISQPGILDAARVRPEPQPAINSNTLTTPAVSVQAGSEQPEVTAFRPSWIFYVAAVYIGGVLLFAMRLLLAFLLIRRTLRRTRNIWPELLRLGILTPTAAKAQIEESEHVKVPVTLGLLRMRVILPVDWHTWPQKKITVVLAHELAHVRRRDPLFALLAAINKCVFWFHPLAWWLQSRLAVLAEHAADDAGIKAARDAASYARVVLEVAASMTGQDRRLIWNSSAIGGVGMTGPTLARRIRRVIRLQGAEYAKRLGKTARLFLFASALLFLWVAVACDFQGATHAFYVASAQDDKYFESLRSHLDECATPEQAAQKERQLAANPEDETTRYQLLYYYWWLDPAQGHYGNGPKDRRSSLIFWLIDHHPQSRLHALFEAQIHWGDVFPDRNAVFEEAVQHWRAQVAQHPQDADVLWNAGHAMLSEQHYDEAVHLLMRAKVLDPAHEADALADLYTPNYGPFELLLSRVRDMTTEQAAKLERLLAADPEDEITRYRLLFYYGLKAQPSALNRPGDPRIPLIFWLIDHHPESKLHAVQDARLEWYGVIPDSNPVFENLVKHWQAQVARHPQDADVLWNAGKAMLSAHHAREGVDLLKHAQVLDSAHKTDDLAELYSKALAAHTEIGTIWRRGEDPGLVAQIRRELSASNDLALVGRTAIGVVESTVALRDNPDHDWDLAALNAIASELLGRVRKLDPQSQHLNDLLQRDNLAYETNRSWSDMMSSWVSVSPEDTRGNLIKAVPSVHPPGNPGSSSVELQVRIDKEGHVADAKQFPGGFLLVGHPKLLQAAIDAARQCVYKPFLVNANPVEVLTTVEVDIPSPDKS